MAYACLTSSTHTIIISSLFAKELDTMATASRKWLLKIIRAEAWTQIISNNKLKRENSGLMLELSAFTPQGAPGKLGGSALSRQHCYHFSSSASSRRLPLSIELCRCHTHKPPGYFSPHTCAVAPPFRRSTRHDKFSNHFLQSGSDPPPKKCSSNNNNSKTGGNTVFDLKVDHLSFCAIKSPGNVNPTASFY